MEPAASLVSLPSTKRRRVAVEVCKLLRIRGFQVQRFGVERKAVERNRLLALAFLLKFFPFIFLMRQSFVKDDLIRLSDPLGQRIVVCEVPIRFFFPVFLVGDACSEARDGNKYGKPKHDEGSA